MIVFFALNCLSTDTHTNVARCSYFQYACANNSTLCALQIEHGSYKYIEISLKKQGTFLVP